ncbi:MAG: lysophospholipid acyltransferase family protein [Candidatus Pacebacteria bacterium]|nr:lysophospholipid acyltransferase family protein [Candidatus Paceibacterota bacterium]
MNRTVSFICKLILAPLLFMLLIKSVSGKKRMKKNNNFILASNHQSYLDILASGYVCLPRRFTFIGQVDKGKGLLGFLRNALYSAAEIIPLHRGEERSRKEAVEAAIRYLQEGYSLVIYPEGKRSLDGKVQEGKTGVARIFLQTGVPIIPMGINGAYELYPPKGKLNIKRNIEINIGDPLYFKEELEESKKYPIDSDEYKEICVRITGKVMEEIKKLVYEKDK